VDATFVEIIAPVKLRMAAMIIAALIDNARVETHVAIALAVS
jgi:hypothetical protein